MSINSNQEMRGEGGEWKPLILTNQTSCWDHQNVPVYTSLSIGQQVNLTFSNNVVNVSYSVHWINVRIKNSIWTTDT